MICTYILRLGFGSKAPFSRKGDDTVGSSHRAQIFNSSFSSFILLFELAKRFPVEGFEAMPSQSTVPPPRIDRASGTRAPPPRSEISV